MATLDSAPGGQKTTYYSGDRLLISDQEDAGDSKYIETDVILTEARDKTGLTEKTTIVGADVSEINDSADTYSPKKVLKSTEKNFFMPHDYINEFQLKSNSTTWSSIDYTSIYAMVNGSYNEVAAGTVTNGSTSANTFYAVWFKSNTVSVTTCGWTGVSGGSLNVYDALYDQAKGYCYDSTNGRLIAILRTNGTNTGYGYIIPIYTVPYTQIIATSNAGSAQSFTSGSEDAIKWEDIVFDLNSELETTNYTTITSKLLQEVDCFCHVNKISDASAYYKRLRLNIATSNIYDQKNEAYGNTPEYKGGVVMSEAVIVGNTITAYWVQQSGSAVTISNNAGSRIVVRGRRV